MCRIVIDCDPGIDDSLALMLALASPELDIAGITTVSGNVPVDMGTENAAKVLAWMGRTEIPIYKGEAVPLKREYIDAMDTHGRDGMGESFYPAVSYPKQDKDAVQFLEELLEKEKISIIALGPMTNLAKLFLKRPDLMKQVEELVSMGGSFKSHGNCSPVAEYNYWCDPHGAAACYDAFAKAGKKIHMIGLDVTRKIVLTPNILEYICRLDPKTGEFIRSFDADEREMTKYIIGTISEMDVPMTPSGKGNLSLNAWFSKVTEEDMAKERQEILEAQPEDIRKLAGIVDVMMEQNRICVVGSEEKLEQEKQIFGELRNLL